MRPDDDDVQEEIVSGPFCSHWGDPSDCDYECRCGHPCKDHSISGDCRRCQQQLLSEPWCEKFEDRED